MLLTFLIFCPILASVALMLLREDQVVTRRYFAFLIYLFVGIGGLCLAILGGPELFVDDLALMPVDGPLLRHDVRWFNPAAMAGDAVAPVGYWDIRFHVGVDGISLWLVVLAALMCPALIASAIANPPQLVSPAAKVLGERGYLALLMLLSGALIGVFAARDLLLFFIFFEFTLLPAYLLIGIYGGEQRRKAAATMFVYTFVGSMLMFAGILYLAYKATTFGPRLFTFDIDTLAAMARAGHLTAQESWWVFAAMFAGFAVKVPLFPLHTWLPLTHENTPAGGTVDLSIVLMKLGLYGFARFALVLLPDAAFAWAPFIATLAVISVIYGGLAALVQSDMRRLLAYSSVSHLGLCVLGLFSMNAAGLTGGVLYIFNYAIASGALFLLVGMLLRRIGTTKISDVGGLYRVMPGFAWTFVFFAMCSIALPGTANFVSEFLVLLGAFVSRNPEANGIGLPGPLSPAFAIVAALGVVISAAYLLNLVRRLIFGPVHYPGYVPAAHDHGHGDADSVLQAPPASPAHKPPADLTSSEIGILVPFAIVAVVIGIFPRFMTVPIENDAAVIARQVVVASRPARHVPHSALAEQPAGSHQPAPITGPAADAPSTRLAEALPLVQE